MSGFTLHYDGAKFGSPEFFSKSDKSERDESQRISLTQTEKLGYCFSQIGALAIRFHNGQSQRSDLLQGVARKEYQLDPVESTAKGDDEPVFSDSEWSLSPVCQAQTAKLGKCALSTLGKGKLLNERGQRLFHFNRNNLRGEQHLWERIHASVWHTGICFANQLVLQGFTYICCPPGLKKEEYERIDEALSKGKYYFEGSAVVVLGNRLQTCSPSILSQKSMTGLDPQHEQTFQPNGLVVKTPGEESYAPLGWMVHQNNHKVLPQHLMEDCFKIIHLAKGGFHELTPPEQKLLEIGPQNGLGAFTQSPVFNAMYEVCNHLEKEYGFDPEKLMGSSIKTSFQRVNEFFSNPENMEDFLTGPLLTEMVQSLRVTQQNSPRSRKIPLRLTYPFRVLHNTAKAIAYAYDLKYKGMPLLRFESLTKDQRLPDVSINGELALPSLSFGKHASAILSTALLVGEQMLLEQILRDAIKTGGARAVVNLLNKIMGGNPEAKMIAEKIMKLSAQADQDEHGPVLGLQFEQCEEIISLLRKSLGFDLLINLADTLDQQGIMTDDALNAFFTKNSKEKLDSALQNLFRLGELIQSTPHLSAQSEGSKGINAGLVLLINKISADSIESATGTYQIPKIAREEISATDKRVEETAIVPRTSPSTVLSLDRKQQAAIAITLLILMFALSMSLMGGSHDKTHYSNH
ncbi:MAG: hypothetical protein JSS60_02950 [Verrucomicrobia bacterium]|nr:hypothetical protein [Verrucomicrobiota bacterium]